MDDNDEFGELYTDVLHSVAESVPAPLPSVSSPGGRLEPLLHAEKDDSDGGDPDGRLFVASLADPCAESPSSSKRAIPPAMAAAEDVLEEDWMLGRAAPVVDSTVNWNDEDYDGTLSPRQAEVGAPSASIEGEPRVLEEDEEDVRVSKFQEREDRLSLLGRGIEQSLENLDQTPHIPGLSADPASSSSGLFPGINNEERKQSQNEDWDSDSEDDLKIVLNDSNHGPLVADDDDDGEEDLIIVTDEDQHHRLPAMEEQDWTEEAMQPAGDGERKDTSDVAKVTGSAGAVPGARIGYSNHGFHTQHHSMFKVVPTTLVLVIQV